MEIYAAMVANLDWNIGRLIDHLKETGEYDNTLILFLSDNGPDEKDPRFIWGMFPEDVSDKWAGSYDLSLENMGRPNSYVSYEAWAQAGNGPLSLFKGNTTQGGMQTFMISKPAGAPVTASVSDAFVTVMDLAPTFLELADTSHPSMWDGQEVHPLKGGSILPLLEGSADRVHDDDYVFGLELNESQSVRKGDWKIVWNRKGPFSFDGWRLFNLAEDPAETNDLANAQPEKMAEMLAAWDQYVLESELILPLRPEAAQGKNAFGH